MQMHVRYCTLWLAVVASGFGTVGLDAQRQRASPHEKVNATVDGAAISVEYGRPYVKGRAIFGALVPYGQVWRTGADEATTLVTDKTLVFGSTQVPAGTYTLYSLPTEQGWTLVINKQTGQWGTEYDASQDLGRVQMKMMSNAKPVEQFTIAVRDTPSGGALEFAWADRSATADFTVKK